jgi:hypothetical protein
MSIALSGHETEICRALGDLQLVIGQDAEGHWILAEHRKRYGGIFVSREAALKFAASELGIDSSAICLSDELLALRS